LTLDDLEGSKTEITVFDVKYVESVTVTMLNPMNSSSLDLLPQLFGLPVILDDAGRREHSKTLREEADIGYKEVRLCKSNVVGNVLPDSCMECATLNDFKTKNEITVATAETQIYCNVWYISDSRLYMAILKHVSTYVISVFHCH